MDEINFENAEGSENRTRKLNKLVDEILIDYSFEEQLVGIKHTDGTQVYQKTLAFGAVGTGEQTVVHGIADIGVILKTEGYATQANGVVSTFPRLSAGTPLVDSIFFSRHTATNLYGYVGTGFTAGTAITGGQVTIRYTKV